MTESHKSASDNDQDGNKKDYILSIETAVCGGSLAIFKNGQIIVASKGTSKVSNSEDILDEIQTILTKNKIDKTKIKLVVFSRGPGSFTGIRIGAAFAQGLSKAINCDYLGLPILEVIIGDRAENKKVITAVEFGKNQVCWQLFKIGPEGMIQYGLAPRISKIISFLDELESEKFDSLILPAHLYNILPVPNQEKSSGNRQIIKAGDNLAVLMVEKAEKLKNSRLINQKDILRPIYITDSKNKYG